MQDEPTPRELLAAVSAWMRRELLPAAPANMSFHVRVAANAIDLALRQLALEPGANVAELARLKALLGSGGSLEELNAALAGDIASGAVDGEDPRIMDHLYATTLEKLAVDQPNYAACRRAAGT